MARVQAMKQLFARLMRAFKGDTSAKFLAAQQPIVLAANALEATMQGKTPAELLAVTAQLRARLAKGEALDALMPEAFAAVREAALRALGLRAFDVQLLGALALHHGQIAEMKTGEGKTLVAVFAAYVNALPSKGVHIVTVNDYLARRDAGWMGQVLAVLGLTTGAVYHGQDPAERQAAYQADVTYATNNELGFDYLRDNMAMHPSQLVQRPMHYAIIDEVDSILIDEARTPLIISGPSEDRTDLYQAVDALMPTLEEGRDYEVDLKQKSVSLTELGTDAAEAYLTAKGLLPAGETLYDPHHIALIHHITQGLRAHVLYRKDVEYIVRPGKDGQPEVVLIDEFTGRMMTGRRLSDGLHQAIEAKEGVALQPENQTMASITFQNLFRLYPMLAGMTGTAATEAEEFLEIYRLPVISVPTNVEVSRKDEADIIFTAREGKRGAIVADIQECFSRGQPVLVGTVTIERSEELSEDLKKVGVPHQVLNARYHEQEASIIAQAGRKGAVTIATNMAGRGTDIKLGGNLELLLSEATTPDAQARVRAQWEAEHAEVMVAGGLRVIGTERHESRRIDNQLRGRSGRQGDVGSSVFYLSMQDDLIKRFVPNIEALLGRLNVPDNDSVQHPWLAKSIENAQRKIEALNFDLRKNILKYDEVLNDQRRVIYDQRHEVLHSSDLASVVVGYRHEVLDDLLQAAFLPESLPEDWQTEKLEHQLHTIFNLPLPVQAPLQENPDLTADRIGEALQSALDDAWAHKQTEFPADLMRSLERMVLLQTVDRLWRQHLQALDLLRKGIGWRGYAQKDPLNEYAKESFQLFEDMLTGIKRETVTMLSRMQIAQEQAPVTGPVPADASTKAPAKVEAPVAPAKKAPATVQQAVAKALSQGQSHAENKVVNGAEADAARRQALGVMVWENLQPLDPRIPRLAPCPCGSGRRFKECHGHLSRLPNALYDDLPPEAPTPPVAAKVVKAPPKKPAEAKSKAKPKAKVK